jgi:hypothetical protein
MLTLLGSEASSSQYSLHIHHSRSCHGLNQTEAPRICTLTVVISRIAFHVGSSNRIPSIWHGNTGGAAAKSHLIHSFLCPLSFRASVLLAAAAAMELMLAADRVCTNCVGVSLIWFRELVGSIQYNW